MVKELLRIELARRQMRDNAATLNALIRAGLGTNDANCRRPREIALLEIVRANNELSVALNLYDVELRKLGAEK